MDSRGDGDLGQAGGHELEQRHLGGGVLHRHPVGVEVGVALATDELLALGIDEVVDEDLLGEREGAAEALAAESGLFREGRVDALDELDRGGGADGAHGLPFWCLPLSPMYTTLIQVNGRPKPVQQFYTGVRGR